MRALILDEKKCLTLKNCIEEIHEGLFRLFHDGRRTTAVPEEEDSDDSGD